jgi:hypothetical protein
MTTQETGRQEVKQEEKLMTGTQAVAQAVRLARISWKAGGAPSLKANLVTLTSGFPPSTSAIEDRKRPRPMTADGANISHAP